MVESAKLLFVPGSVAFLVIGLLIALGLLYGGKIGQRWGRRLLTLLLIVYTCLAMPVGATLVTLPLTWQYGSLGSKTLAGGIDTIVTLTTGVFVYRGSGLELVELGSHSSHSAIETARLYRLLGHPGILVSGGVVEPGAQSVSEADVLRDRLERLGVPPEKIVVETKARNTREQAELTSAILRERHVRRFVLVTDPAHMARATSEFRRLGLDPVPSVSAGSDSTPPGWLQRLRPNINSLKDSEWACYEYGARLFYWLRDVTGRP